MWLVPDSLAASITCRASDVVTSVVGPFSVGPIVTTTLVAFPIAFAMVLASLKLDSTALSRFDSSFDMICRVREIKNGCDNTYEVNNHFYEKTFLTQLNI